MVHRWVLLVLLWGSPALAGFEDSPKQVVDEVWQMVNSNYVDAKKDWPQVRTTYLGRDYGTSEEAYTAIREMLKGLNDPYTRFMDPKQYNNSRVAVSGEYAGVGITVISDPLIKEPRIIAVTPETPAQRAGLLTQDFIQAINGVSTKAFKQEETTSRIRGKVGTAVTLTIRRGSQIFDVEIMREVITIPAVRSSVKQVQGQSIGYISLREFTTNSPKQMRQAVRDLLAEKVTGFILDLRNNPGGLVGASRSIAGIFLEDDQRVVSTVNRKGIINVLKTEGTPLTEKPVVILVNGRSASASEILAAALRDNKRATLVGTKTFGKGLVQAVFELSDTSGLAVTIQHYKTPAGKDIHKKGIQPDYVVEIPAKLLKTLQPEDVATPKDPQYQRAAQVLLGSAKP